MNTKLKQTIGFIGAGQMARALAGGFVAGSLADAAQICASDPSDTARKHFLESLPTASISADNTLAASSEVVFLAVKPQNMATVLEELREKISANQLVVSIAAGVTLATLEAALAPRVRVIRVMPNTPCLIRQGACAFSLGAAATSGDAELVRQMLSAVGLAIEVGPSQLDAVTGLSGSGPAYFFEMIDALAEAGAAMGLTREIALQLAAQTALGAAQMVVAGGQPSTLRDQVTSPGGTTLAGLNSLEADGFRAVMAAAVKAATLRSQELGT